MARGWESKHVEEQQAERERAERAAAPAPGAADAERAGRRRTLELARVRTAADLAAARSDAHRRMLQAALDALDDQLRNV